MSRGSSHFRISPISLLTISTFHHPQLPISLVQALALCSDYMQKRNKPNSGYTYVGLARRIAIGIGLHKELPCCKTNLFIMETRRRTWCCLYIFDVVAITTFTRPLDFPGKGFNVQLSVNVYDSDITMGTTRLPQPVNATTMYTHLRAQATFHMATSEIQAKTISAPFPPASELIELDDKMIGGWLTTLPPYFREHVVQIPNFSLRHSVHRWRYRNFRILMYRPFMIGRLMVRPERALPRKTKSQADIAIERCLNAARESVELISTFLGDDNRRMLACWYEQYFLLQAIAIPAICLRNDPQASRAIEWRDLIVQAMQVLESIAHVNPSSTRYLGIIRILCGAYLDSSFDKWGPATEEPPQTQLTNLYPLMWPIPETAQMEEIDTDLQESRIMDFLNQLPAME